MQAPPAVLLVELGSWTTDADGVGNKQQETDQTDAKEARNHANTWPKRKSHVFAERVEDRVSECFIEVRKEILGIPPRNDR